MTAAITFQSSTGQTVTLPPSECIRVKPPLPPGAMLYFSFEVPRFQYSLAVSEQFDIGRFTLKVFPLIIGANVTIREINTNAANVTISEINVKLSAP